MRKVILFIICTMVLIFSCKKDKVTNPNGPCTTCVSCTASGNKPTIAYNTYEQKGHDTLILKLNFCDKDGDLGLGTFDTAGILKDGNIFLVYYFKNSLGNWSTYDAYPSTPQFDTLTYRYKFPLGPTPPILTTYISSGMYNPVTVILRPSSILEGEMQIRMVNYYNPTHQEIKFEVFLFDKALNRSNRIATASIYP